MSPNSTIHVFLRIGHHAHLRSDHHPKHHHFTHNWSAYVEGCHGIKLEHFVEKVIFRLHESFDNPVQIREKPPYRIDESGYASFIMYIDVYFKNPAHPNKIEYQYDLTLPGVGTGAFSDSRSERITFRNTQETFRQCLLRGGAKETDSDMLEDMKRKKEEQQRLKAKKDKKHRSKPHKHKSEYKKTPPSAFGLAKDKKSRSSHDDDSSSSSSLTSSSPPITSTKESKGPTNTGTGLSDLSDSDDNTKDSFSLQVTHHRSNNSSAKPVKKHKTSQPPPPENTRKAKKTRIDGVVRAQNGVSIESLLDLHEKIKTIQDPDLLQRVVDIIGKSGKFKVAEATLDFDLCLLEAEVIRHLKTVVPA